MHALGPFTLIPLVLALIPACVPASAAEVEETPILRVDSGETTTPDLTAYDPYVGAYVNEAMQRTMTVRVQDGSLALDIPDQVVLALEDPDDEGAWYAKLSDRLFLTFERDDTGAAVAMRIHELIRLQRVADPEVTDEGVPDRFRPHLGTYLLAPLNAEFKVIYREDSLAVEDPLAQATIGLQLPDERGGWKDEFDKNTISFDREEGGFSQTLTIESVIGFRR